MLESFLCYVGAFLLFVLLLRLADYLNTRERRAPERKQTNFSEKLSGQFVGLNVSSIPVTLEEIKQREWKDELDMVELELKKVSRLIETYVSWEVPAEELYCFFERKGRLIKRYEQLVLVNPWNEVACLPDETTIIPPEKVEVVVVVPRRSKTPKALPAVKPSVLRGVRPKRTNSSNNIS